MDRCVDAIVEAERSLPRVGLIVLDDWCTPIGRIEKDHMDAVLDLAKRIDDSTTLLLITKSGTDVTGDHEAFRARSKTNFEKAQFEIWGLYANERGEIHLDMNGEVLIGKIEESGFVF